MTKTITAVALKLLQTRAEVFNFTKGLIEGGGEQTILKQSRYIKTSNFK